MAIQHTAILDANTHEPKHITDATTADHGKVITPSSVSDGESQLVQLETADLSDGADLATLTDAQTLTNKRITPRISNVAYAANIGVDSDLFDILACDSVTGNITVDNPTGTPTDGQALVVRLTQDGVGSHTVTFDTAFAVDSSSALTASATSTWTFLWHAARSEWVEASATLDLS